MAASTLSDIEPGTVAEQRPSDSRSRRDVNVGLIRIGIVLGAAAVRLLGANYGFPLLLHPDEFAVVDAVADMAERNSFEPPWSYRPDHVEMKADYGVFWLYAHLVQGTSIDAAYAQDRLPFYYLARLMTAMFGIGSVILAYAVGARWSRRVGLVAMALFAFFPPFVLHAHYATPDVPLTFAVMLLVYALMRYVDSTSWRSLLLACFAVALAVGIKYPGAVGAVMIAIIVGATAWRDRAPRRFVAHGVGSAVASTAFLFAISPTLFTNFNGVREELRVQSAGDRLGHPDLGFLGNLEFYVVNFVEPVGLLVGVLALVGLVLAVHRRRLDVVPWFTGVLVWLSLSALPMTWERWGLPMWVTPLLLAAVAVSWLVERCWASRRTRWVPVLVIGVVAAQLALGSVNAVGTLVAQDTRQASRTWAEQHGVDADESTYEGYTPYLPGDPYLFFTDQVRAEGDGYAFLTKNGEPARFVILSSNMYQRVLADPSYAREQAIYQYVFDNFDEIATFEPGIAARRSVLEPVNLRRQVTLLDDLADGALAGPTIRIFEIPSDGTPAG